MMEARYKDEVMKVLVREGVKTSAVSEECISNTEICIRRVASLASEKKRSFSPYKPIFVTLGCILTAGFLIWCAGSIFIKPDNIAGLVVASGKAEKLQNTRISLSAGYNIKEKDVIETKKDEFVILERADNLHIKLFSESILIFSDYSENSDIFQLELEKGSLYINKTFSPKTKELSFVKISDYEFRLTGTRVYFAVNRDYVITAICYEGSVQVWKNNSMASAIKKGEKITIQTDGTLKITTSSDWKNDEWKPDEESYGISEEFESGNNHPARSTVSSDKTAAASNDNSQPVLSKTDAKENRNYSSTEKPAETTVSSFSLSPDIFSGQPADESTHSPNSLESNNKVPKTPDTDLAFRNSFYKKIAKLDIKTAALTDVINAFGGPLRYSLNGATVDTDNLPTDFIMNYPDRFSVFIHENKLARLRYENPGYTFMGGISIGASKDEVLNVLGKPVKIVTGSSNEGEDRVLYTDIDGVAGKSCYKNKQMGMIAFFSDNKLDTMIILAGN
jgi:hypothetical protein